MLSIEVQNGNAKIKASGSLKELTADIALIVSDIYSQLLQSNEDCAHVFRSAMIHVMADPDSPVWSEHAHLDGFGICSVRKDGEGNA